MRADDNTPEPAGAAGPETPQPTVDEIIAMAKAAVRKEKGDPQLELPVVGQEGWDMSTESPPQEPVEAPQEPEVELNTEPTPFVLARPVADWITLVSGMAMKMEPTHAAIVVSQIQDLCRDMRSAVARKDKHQLARDTIAAGSMLLMLFLLASPQYQAVEEGEEPIPPPEPLRLVT